MGHKGDIEHIYTVNKGLPEDIIEKMRQAYARGSSHLITIGKEETSHDKILETFNLQFLTIAGHTKDEIDKLGNLSKLGVEQMQQLIKKKSMETLGLNGNSQKVVSLAECKDWIMNGWEFVSTLPDNEVIIRLPVLN